MDLMRKRWHRYRYKNITCLIIGVLIAFVLLRNDSFHWYIQHAKNYGYIGVFIGGTLFVSTFTVSIGAVLLLILAESIHPLVIAAVAGAGAVIGDLTIFGVVRNDGFTQEVKHFFRYFGGDKLSHLLHSKYFGWTLPVVGALIIASPLPDELGVSLMGISRLKTYQFILLSFILNSLGIFLILSASLVLKP